MEEVALGFWGMEVPVCRDIISWQELCWLWWSFLWEKPSWIQGYARIAVVVGCWWLFLLFQFISLFSPPSSNCPSSFHPKTTLCSSNTEVSPEAWAAERRFQDQELWIWVLPGDSGTGRWRTSLPPAWEANSQGCFLPASKKFGKTGIKIPVVILFHPFPNSSIMQGRSPGDPEQFPPTAHPCLKQSLMESSGSFPHSSRTLQAPPMAPTSQLISSLGFQGFQTHCCDRTRIFDISCPEGSSCPSRGEYFSSPWEKQQSILLELGNITEPLQQTFQIFN